MPVSDGFLAYVLDQFSLFGEVRAKRMFGGVGLYCEGKMFGLLADDVAYLKVGEANRPDFEKAGSRPFQPFKEKNLTMSYYEIPGEVLEDRDELARWARVGLLVAQKQVK